MKLLQVLYITLFVLIGFLVYKVHTTSTMLESMQAEIIRSQNAAVQTILTRVQNANMAKENIDNVTDVQLDNWLCGTGALSDC